VSTRAVFGRELVPVVTAAEAAAHDRYAHQECKIPERALMENAARALALVTHRLFPTGRIAGIAGKGNNGGDVTIALDALERWGRDVQRVATADDDFRTAAVVLDGILGTGTRGQPRAEAADLIRAANNAGVPVIAADLPSGVDPSSGEVHDPAIRAFATVCFGFPKIGLLRHPGRVHCGRLICVEMGFPSLPADQLRALLITPGYGRRHLPARGPSAHKGHSGRLVMLVGSHGMAGAAIISAQAAIHAGAGLVRIASSADNRELLQNAVPEATFFERDGTIDLIGATAVVAGCGLGTDQEAERALQQFLLESSGVATLLDADALNLLAGQDGAIEQIAAERPLVITPHPREMSRLMHTDVEEIAAFPSYAAQTFADATGATVLLKGQPSLVASPEQPLLINTVGSSDVAVAGMGDQLSGVIGAMLAAGLAPREAAATGLFFSGRAADLAAKGRALSPRDVTESLAAAFADPGPAESSLGLPFVTFDQPERW
jgi:NAD(P)H-hydrate epimerase